MDNNNRSCVNCGVLKCRTGEGEFPEFCLTSALSEEEIEELARLYQEPENHKFALYSAEVEGEFYGIYTRVEETIEFARRIGARKLGIATCLSLLEESRILTRILKLNGFEVFTAMCKVGGMDKEDVIGVDEQYMQKVGHVMCNPILQAKLMNKEAVDLAIVMGLCVGHDSLFYKYIERPVTTLVVKDRALGNNPVQALYMTKTYKKKLLAKPLGEN